MRVFGPKLGFRVQTRHPVPQSIIHGATVGPTTKEQRCLQRVYKKYTGIIGNYVRGIESFSGLFRTTVYGLVGPASMRPYTLNP